MVDRGERKALEDELAREKADHSRGKRMTLIEALSHPKVLLLTLAYLGTVTASYAVEFFMPKSCRTGTSLNINNLTLLIILHPPLGAVRAARGRLEFRPVQGTTLPRRVPLLVGSTAMAFLPFTQGDLG